MSTASILDASLHLRQRLHTCPEVSFKESETSRAVAEWLEQHGLSVTRNVARTGLVVELTSHREGPTRLFRADLDAIGTARGGHEVNLGPRLARHSSGENAEHVCGHDGHSAMLSGALATLATDLDAWSGKVIGVFQPAEEIGEGARAMLAHEALLNLNVDQAYSVHNQPGLAFGTIGIAVGVAALASVGVVVRLEGQGTHASTPHKGNAAISAMATLIRELLALPSYVVPFGSSVLVTPTYLDAGKRQFGRVPPAGELGLVLRGDDSECLDNVLTQARARAESLAASYGLTSRIELVEPFPTTINDHAVVSHVEEALGAAGFAIEVRERAQPWSEDFGYFLERWPGALLLLGAGEDHPSLHSEQYEFPDPLLAHGIDMWLTLAGWTGPQTR